MDHGKGGKDDGGGGADMLASRDDDDGEDAVSKKVRENFLDDKWSRLAITCERLLRMQAILRLLKAEKLKIQKINSQHLLSARSGIFVETPNATLHHYSRCMPCCACWPITIFLRTKDLLLLFRGHFSPSPKDAISSHLFLSSPEE